MEEGLDSRQRAPCLQGPAIHAAPSSALVTESLSVSTLVNRGLSVYPCRAYRAHVALKQAERSVEFSTPPDHGMKALDASPRERVP